MVPINTTYAANCSAKSWATASRTVNPAQPVLANGATGSSAEQEGRLGAVKRAPCTTYVVNTNTFVGVYSPYRQEVKPQYVEVVSKSSIEEWRNELESGKRTLESTIDRILKLIANTWTNDKSIEHSSSSNQYIEVSHEGRINLITKYFDTPPTTEGDGVKKLSALLTSYLDDMKARYGKDQTIPIVSYRPVSAPLRGAEGVVSQTSTSDFSTAIGTPLPMSSLLPDSNSEYVPVMADYEQPKEQEKQLLAAAFISCQLALMMTSAGIMGAIQSLLLPRTETGSMVSVSA